MFRYYLALGVRNLRRNPILTALMILTLAVGVAASVSTLTILHVMSNDPMPQKSARLLVPLIDPGDPAAYVPGNDRIDRQTTYRDAMAYLDSGIGRNRAVVYRIAMPLELPASEVPIEAQDGLAVSSGWFAIFEPPFLHGGRWSEADDRAAARVVVLSRNLSEKLFGSDDPVGRMIRLSNNEFRIVGVLDTWSPVPRYTHLINGSFGAFGGEDDFYIPLAAATAAEVTSNGSTDCSVGGRARTTGYRGLLESECTWIQTWFEMDSPSDRDKLLSWLNGYVAEQRKFGRLQRPAPPRVFDVQEWMTFLQVISNDTRLAAWLSFGFLLLCLVNTVGLLLAKYSVRAPEIGVRRALGATRSAIFRQFLVESAVVGIAGGVAGLCLAAVALALIARSSRGMAAVAHLDVPMLVITFVLAVAASLLAGLLPTWRASQVTPAVQLKSQ